MLAVIVIMSLNRRKEVLFHGYRKRKGREQNGKREALSRANRTSVVDLFPLSPHHFLSLSPPLLLIFMPKVSHTLPLIPTTTYCTHLTKTNADILLTPHAFTCTHSPKTSACQFSDIDMDQSTSSIFSNGTSSPNLSRSRVLSELESNLSALGHVGLLKYSRDELRRQLQQQKSQTEQQSQAAATLRRIALRLTVNGQEKQDKLTELISTVHQYEDQGQKLLETLNEHDNSTTTSSACSWNKSSDPFVSDHGSQSLHGPSRPLSPPTTPMDRRITFGPITPASSSPKIVSRSSTSSSKRRDSHQLPTEVLQLCQQRVEGLLRQNRSNRQTIDQLRHSEVSLHRIIEKQEEELRSLDAARLTSENELKTAQSKLSSAREELVHLQKHIQQLEKDKASANGAFQSHENRTRSLEAELGNAAHALDEAETEKRDLQHTYNNAIRELRDVQQIQTSLESAVRRHENDFDTLNRDLTASRDELFTSGQQLYALQEQLEKSETMSFDLRAAITSHKQYQHEQKRDLEDSRESHSAIANELVEAKQQFVDATDLHKRTTQDLENERQSAQELRNFVSTTEKDLQRARANISELESAHHELKTELTATQSLKAGFAESCIRLQQELDTEKARAAEVETALRKDLAESEGKMANIQRFTDLLKDKLKETQAELGQKTTDLQRQISSLEKDLTKQQKRAAALEESLREEIARSEDKATSRFFFPFLQCADILEI